MVPVSEPDKSKDKNPPKGKAVKFAPPWELRQGRRKRPLDAPRHRGQLYAMLAGVLAVQIAWVVFPALVPPHEFFSYLMLFGGGLAGWGVFELVKILSRRSRAAQFVLAGLIGIAALSTTIYRCQPGPNLCRPDGGEIVEYGTYMRETHPVENYWLLEQIDKLPKDTGVTGFGIKFIVTAFLDIGTVDVMIRVTHPPVNGQTFTELPQQVVLGYASFAAYRFQHDYQRVPGTWTFQVIHEEEVLAEKSFQVTDD
jgi:hypothetical protein